MTTLRKYVTAKLRADGYGGLSDYCGCGCRLDDLMPCDEPSALCEPGYAHTPTDDDCAACEAECDGRPDVTSCIRRERP